MATPSQEWRNILWREWRNCEDAQYAHYLFESLTGSGSIWFTPAVQIITGLFDNFGGLREVKWRNYDPSESAPFFVALILGSVTGLVVGLISGAGTGLVAGLGIAALSFLLLMMILILIPKLRQRVGVLFDRFYSQEQPTMAEVETALQQASKAKLRVQAIWAEPLHCLAKQKQHPDSLENLITGLQSTNWITRFSARYGLIAWGGAAVEPLQGMVADNTLPISRSALRALKNIALETTATLAEQSSTLLCPRCLVYCQARPILLAGQPDLIFYGCRSCNQSREFLEGINYVIAILDATWPEGQFWQDGTLRVNWLIYRTIFDFDQVEIVQANDEDVERFAMQVGNDTDPFRKPRYWQMTCTIGSACRLSENTLRILEKMFGRVELERVNP
jgi:hypothetical protein